jgi:hypothetical protein
VRACVVAILALAPLTGWFLAPTKANIATGSTLVERGLMPDGVNRAGFPTPPGLLVDSTLHRGYVFDESGGYRIRVYDLVERRHVFDVQLPTGTTNGTRSLGMVDPVHHRVFWTLGPASIPSIECRDSPIGVLDEITLKWSVMYIPCLTDPVPGGLLVNGMSYDAVPNKLYFIGVPASTFPVYRLASPPYQPTIVAQLDGTTLALDWSVGLTQECPWNEMGSAATIGRSGHLIITYCLRGGLNQNAGGGRGLAVSFPVDDDDQLIKPVQARVDTTYTDNGVLREVDPVTGRLLLISRVLPFGPAVWVYDTRKGWFNGVVPTGNAQAEEEDLDYGFDPVSGRVYLHSKRGYVVVDARHTPLPGGISYSADAQRCTPCLTTTLSVDTGLRRLFRYDKDHSGWVVVDDLTPDVPTPPAPDPDRGTAHIPEQPGVTDRTYAASASAFGAHILSAGGIPTPIQGSMRRADCVRRVVIPGSGCVLPGLVSPGDREYFVAQTSVGLGSTAGGAAFATGARASPRDYATDSDARAIGRCYADRLEQLLGGTGSMATGVCQLVEPLANQAAQGPLTGLTLGSLRSGTTPHADGKDDVPIPSSQCTDFGDTPVTNQPPETGSSTWSRVTCDAEQAVFTAESRTATVAFPTIESSPVVSVARTTSSMSTALDPQKGLLTTATATAEGVSIGGQVSIARLTTTATVSANGQSGHEPTFTRTISGVSAPGYSCTTADSCRLDQVVDAINKAFSGTLVVSIPEPHLLATQFGATALMSKDPERAASDAAINDDDTVTVDALDFLFINDYSYGNGVDGQRVAGRSRFLVGLAGVQVESHYGVFLLPTSDADATTSPTATGSLQDQPTLLGTDPVGPYAVVPVPENGLERALSADPRGSRLPNVAQAVRLIVNKPRQAGLLALMLALLVSPVYLAIRRRAVASVWQT